MFFRRVAAFTAVIAVMAAACGSSSTPAPSAGTSTAATACKVGVSWNNFQEPRWAKWDEPAIKKAIAAGGGTYDSLDAKSSAATQASNVETLIANGAKVVIILAQDGTAIKPAVTAALNAHIPVIAYDRLIEDPGVLYLTFDNVLVGNLQAKAIFAAKPTGTYAVIKGNKADANADFLRSGMDQIIGDAVKSGAIKIPAGNEVYTDNWDTKNAQTEMEQILTANNNKIDAVLSENDGMAIGVIAALKAQGLNGKVPVSGQDGDLANLNKVALGEQTVDVWKDARLLGKTAGDAAIALCANADTSKVAGTKPFTTPGKNTINSILLQPDPITTANLKDVLDAGWIDKATLCKDVPAGKVPECS
jgi:D-xylose transport system substrate-binding protein